MNLPVSVSDDFVETLARRVAEVVLAQLERPEWLGVDDAAAHLALTPKAVRGLVERNAIPHYRAGGRIRFERRELDEWARGET